MAVFEPIVLPLVPAIEVTMQAVVFAPAHPVVVRLVVHIFQPVMSAIMSMFQPVVLAIVPRRMVVMGRSRCRQCDGCAYEQG